MNAATAVFFTTIGAVVLPTKYPLASYYRWDRRALVSFFPADRSSADTTQYETSVDSNFTQFIEQRFHESWQAPNTQTLEVHFALTITVIKDGREPQSLLADWVVLEGQVYLAGAPRTD